MRIEKTKFYLTLGSIFLTTFLICIAILNSIEIEIYHEFPEPLDSGRYTEDKTGEWNEWVYYSLFLAAFVTSKGYYRFFEKRIDKETERHKFLWNLWFFFITANAISSAVIGAVVDHWIVGLAINLIFLYFSASVAFKFGVKNKIKLSERFDTKPKPNDS